MVKCFLISFFRVLKVITVLDLFFLLSLFIYGASFQEAVVTYGHVMGFDFRVYSF